MQFQRARRLWPALPLVSAACLPQSQSALLCAPKSAQIPGHGDGAGYPRGFVQPAPSMSQLLPEKFDVPRQAVRARISANTRPGLWLTDETIKTVFSSYLRLSQAIAVIPPAVVSMAALAEADDAWEQVAAADVSNRDLVILPINDGSGSAVNSGTHWSLVAGIATRRPHFKALYAPGQRIYRDNYLSDF